MTPGWQGDINCIVKYMPGLLAQGQRLTLKEYAQHVQSKRQRLTLKK